MSGLVVLSFRLKHSMNLDWILWVCLNPLESSSLTLNHAFLFLICVCLANLWSLIFDAFNLMLHLYILDVKPNFVVTE